MDPGHSFSDTFINFLVDLFECAEGSLVGGVDPRVDIDHGEVGFFGN